MSGDFEKIDAYLAERNLSAVTYTGYDDAITGVVYDPEVSDYRVVYDFGQLQQAIASALGLDLEDYTHYEQVDEYLQYNVLRSVPQNGVGPIITVFDTATGDRDWPDMHI